MTLRKSKDQSRAAHHGKDRDRVLWVNVVLQAIKDSIDSYATQTVERDQARSWFKLSNPDFIQVCFLAGMDPAHVHKHAHDLFTRHDTTVAAGDKFHWPRSATEKVTVDG